VFRIRIGFNADPSPLVYFNADPDPGSKINVDPHADPVPDQTLPSQKVGFRHEKCI
jgi:hypothetical protein